MKRVDIAIVGAGPAGLSAAMTAAQSGVSVLLIERHFRLGGQLIKQTHKFFGSKEQYASMRGFDIGAMLADKVRGLDNVEIMGESTVVGVYEDDVLYVERAAKMEKIAAKRIIMATGAYEKFLSFPNNDLPGVYGAGAVQTLMNEYGVMPGTRALMIGAGNIGLIVSYQLLQAGVDVVAVIDAAPKFGGYLVHYNKLRRKGVPVYTRHTIVRADGKEALESATIAQVDERYNIIKGSEKRLNVDLVCIAVGLSPMVDLLWQRGVKMAYIGQLGGHVPYHTAIQQTSVPSIFVAGDASGIEEASSAMVEGKLAGFYASRDLGYPVSEEVITACQVELAGLRAGPMGEKIRAGITRARMEA